MTLHVAVSGWLLGEPSGANRRLLALLREIGPLLTIDEQVTVLHRPDYRPPAIDGIAWSAVDIPAGPSWRRALAERRRLPAALRELAADVLDHAFLPLPRLPIPICLTVHDLRAADGWAGTARAFVARFVLRRACQRAAAVIAPSAWTAAKLRALAPTAPVPIVVQNAIDPIAADAGARPVRALPDHGYLLHVGHLEPRKNLTIVLDALARIPVGQRPQLWLVGRDAGARRSLLARVQALDLGPSVQWLGVVADDELDRLYAHARAVVVPSHYEGFGLPALEGLAHGRPVLASRTGALPEVLGDQGVLLPADDASMWALAIAAACPGTDVDRQARRAHAGGFRWGPAAATLLCSWRQLGVSPPA